MAAELRVAVDCQGCARKIKKKLEKLDGVDEVEVDMDEQKVTVTGMADEEVIVKAMKKMGKFAGPWLPVQEPYTTSMDRFNHYYGEQIQVFASRANPSDSNRLLTSLWNERKIVDQGCSVNHYYDSGQEYSSGHMRVGYLMSDENSTSCTIM